MDHVTSIEVSHHSQMVGFRFCRELAENLPRTCRELAEPKDACLPRQSSEASRRQAKVFQGGWGGGGPPLGACI